MRTLPKPRTPSSFDALLRIAERGAPFTAAGGRPFITVPAESRHGIHTLPIRSPAFRQWFFQQSYSDYETIPTADSFKVILHHLEAQAARDAYRCNAPIPFRIDSRGPSPTPDKILLDLANPEGQFVEITPEGWTVTVSDRVPFETSSSTRSLPAPEKPPENPTDLPAVSPLDTLRRTLNLGAPNGPDWLRCLAWLLAALRTNGPYPILILRGPSGSGKSTAARILRALIDPSAAPFTPLPGSARELLSLARLNWVLAFDHVSTLSPQIADTLCRLTSGVGVVHREPGCAEPLQLFLKRPIILTVTDRWTPPPDIAARALIVTLPPLADDTRRPDHEIATGILEAFPKILGALCTAVSQALACPPQSTASRTRHASALAWAQAAAPALNCTPQEMADAFHAPPPSDPFVDAVRALLDQTPRWSGSATELLKLLPLCQNPQVLSKKLNQSILPLTESGIDAQFRRLPGGAKVIDLIATQNPDPPPQPEPEKELTSPPEIPPPPAPCDTTVCPDPADHPANQLVGQAGSLRAGCLPAQLVECVTTPIGGADPLVRAGPPGPASCNVHPRGTAADPSSAQVPRSALLEFPAELAIKSHPPPHFPYNERCS